MDTVFMNSINSKTSDPHRLLLNLSDKINLNRRDMLLHQILAYTIHEKTKTSYENNKFNSWAPTWQEEFELPDGSYSVSDIQDYFEYIIRKQQKVTDNLLIKIYVNKIENKIKFKVETGYYLEPLTCETMKFLESLKAR